MDRIAMLTEILTANPGDAFARYGLAMEYANAGKIDEALQQFKTLLEKNPDYVPAYFMAAQTLEKAGRIDEAKRNLTSPQLCNPQCYTLLFAGGASCVVLSVSSFS